MNCNPIVDPKELRAPSIPGNVAFLIVIVAFILLVIAVVLNHLLFSMPSIPYFTFPFFGGIDIERWALYDITLFLFVGSPCMIAAAFVLAARKKSKIMMIKD